MKSRLIVLVALLCIALTGCSAECNGSGCRLSNPSNDAHATAISMAAYLAANSTRQALDEQATRVSESVTGTAQMRQAMFMGTSTAVALQAQGTATAQAQIADATATAVPHQADIANSTANSTMQTQRIVVVAYGMIVAFVALTGLAVVAILRRESKTIRRGADGQLPGMLIGNTVHDPMRAIGPAATLPGSRWKLETAVWAVQCLLAKQVLPLPPNLIQLTDGGASSGERLDAAQSANQAAAMSALSRPDGAIKGKDRVELVKKQAAGGLLGVPSGEVKVTVMSPAGSTDWMSIIASAFEIEPNQLTEPPPIQGDFAPVEVENDHTS